VEFFPHPINSAVVREKATRDNEGKGRSMKRLLKAGFSKPHKKKTKHLPLCLSEHSRIGMSPIYPPPFLIIL
jgi:hypothetical protein